MRRSDRLTDHVSVGLITKYLPRFVVDEILAETGRREKRSRSLPAHMVVYVVVALSIFTDGYEEVLRKLVSGLQFARVWSQKWAVPSTSALSQARARLGEAPLRALFARVAVPVARPTTPGAWLGAWRLMAMDGVMVDVPDTPANALEYPRAEGGTRRPFPQVRIVGLAECGSHAVVAASIGSIHDGERALATQLTSALSDQMLILADRGFHSFELFRAYRAVGAQLLWRLSATVQPTITKVLPDGSYLAEITHKHGRAGKTRIHADQIDNQLLATHITVRIVDYQVSNPDTHLPGELFRLVTTILDPAQASAQELAALYHERWEIESAFREIEIYLRDGAGIRSKSPEMVRQEIWGLLLAHYAVRAFMSEAADTVDIDPDRLSFTRTLNIIRRNVTIPPGLSPLP